MKLLYPLLGTILLSAPLFAGKPYKKVYSVGVENLMIEEESYFAYGVSLRGYKEMANDFYVGGGLQIGATNADSVTYHYYDYEGVPYEETEYSGMFDVDISAGIGLDEEIFIYGLSGITFFSGNSLAGRGFGWGVGVTYNFDTTQLSYSQGVTLSYRSSQIKFNEFEDTLHFKRYALSYSYSF